MKLTNEKLEELSRKAARSIDRMKRLFYGTGIRDDGTVGYMTHGPQKFFHQSPAACTEAMLKELFKAGWTLQHNEVGLCFIDAGNCPVVETFVAFRDFDGHDPVAAFCVSVVLALVALKDEHVPVSQ